MFVFSNLDKNYKVAEVLLKNKAEVNASDNHEWTALQYSVFNGNMINCNLLKLLEEIHHLS